MSSSLTSRTKRTSTNVLVLFYFSNLALPHKDGDWRNTSLALRGVRNCVARLQLLCFLSVFIFGSTTLDELSFFLAGRSQLKLLGYSPIKTPKIRGFFLFFSIF